MTLWQPALKAVAFAVLLIVAAGEIGIFWHFVFLIAAAYFYFQPLLEWKKFFYIFLITAVYSLGVMEFFPGGWLMAVMAAVFGFAFFMLLGLKNFYFLRRDDKLNILTSLVYFLIAAVFFVVDKNGGWNFIFYFLVSFAAFYGVLKEFLDFSHPEFPKTKKALITISSVFLIMELAVAAALLPIGFLNSSVLILLFIFILEDFISYHLTGKMDRQMILNNVTILIVGTLFIFAASKWTL